jgi:hypothetical protein
MEKCEGCARRRKETALMAQAVVEWSKNPIGPNVHAVYLRLRAEAIARGEFDET